MQQLGELDVPQPLESSAVSVSHTMNAYPMVASRFQPHATILNHQEFPSPSVATATSSTSASPSSRVTRAKASRRGP